eukprot:134867-Lingulodinium_polyedra.AAC.1
MAPQQTAALQQQIGAAKLELLARRRALAEQGSKFRAGHGVLRWGSGNGYWPRSQPALGDRTT